MPIDRQNWVAHDPIPLYSTCNSQPRLYTLQGWADIPGHNWAMEGPEAVRFFEEVRRLGTQAGLVIPMHLGDKSRGTVVFPTYEPLEAVRERLVVARIWVSALLPELYAAMRRVYRVAGGRDVPTLTPREREILMLVADGLTSQEIAERLLLAKRTVDLHIVNVQEKLQAENRQQALCKAANLGLIVPVLTARCTSYVLAATRPIKKG